MSPCNPLDGRLVNQDLKWLELTCHSSRPFCGGIDLAGYTITCCILPNIKDIGLADLSHLSSQTPQKGQFRAAQRGDVDQTPDTLCSDIHLCLPLHLLQNLTVQHPKRLSLQAIGAPCSSYARSSLFWEHNPCDHHWSSFGLCILQLI